MLTVSCTTVNKQTWVPALRVITELPGYKQIQSIQKLFYFEKKKGRRDGGREGEKR